MTDVPLPDDLAEIAREAQALVDAAVDADAKQAAAKAAVQNAVEQIVNKAQEAVTKLYGYLKPGAPSPILIVAWPSDDAPVGSIPIEDALPIAGPGPTVEAPIVEVPAPAPEPVVEAPAPVVEAPAPEPVAEQPPAPPVDDFPVVDAETGEDVLAPVPAAEPAAVEPIPPAPEPEPVVTPEAPAAEVPSLPLEPVGGEVAPQEPAFPVEGDVGAIPGPAPVADAPTADVPAAEQPATPGDIINNG